MILNIFFLLFGLGLILVGANILTDGASAIAKRWGVSDLVIGLTVVAFGTSAPELTISFISALNGSTEMAIGNVVGSNIFNVLVIIGMTALFSPIKIGKGIMTKEIPLVILSALVLLVMGNTPLLDRASAPLISRSDGIILLLFFLIFMRYTFSQAKNGTEADADNPTGVRDMPLWRAILYIAGGLAGLIYGGDRFVAGASGIASALGVSDAIIGLTIVAAGTSLPELATSITAAVKGKSGMAVGNVIGSNIFNIFMVLGTTATVRPLAFGSISNLDLLVLFGSCLLFWFFGWFFRQRTITRIEGAVMVLLYIAYVIVLIRQTGAL